MIYLEDKEQTKKNGEVPKPCWKAAKQGGG